MNSEMQRTNNHRIATRCREKRSNPHEDHRSMLQTGVGKAGKAGNIDGAGEYEDDREDGRYV